MFQKMLQVSSSGGGTELVPLWQNPNPTSNFPQKGVITIPNMSNYTHIVIESKFSVSQDMLPRTKSFIEKVDNVLYTVSATGANEYSVVGRLVRLNGNAIEYVNYNGTEGFCIPLNVYGCNL